jgi:hypothetical protein
MYGHNIVVRLHGFLCTLYTIIYVRFLYPICTPYVGYMKSNFFQKRPKSPKKAKKPKKTKIGQKGQIFQKNQKKNKFAKKKQKISQIWLFWQILAFLANFGFLANFWIFWKFLDFFGTSSCLSFRRLHKDYIDREYMTQSR